MKQVLKRIATMATVLALIVITGISMAACGSNGGDSIKDNNIDKLNGFYANEEAQKLYYFDVANETYAYGKFSISDEADENGKYKLTISRDDDFIIPYDFPIGTCDDFSNKLGIYRSEKVRAVFKVWRQNGTSGRETSLINSNDQYSDDLAHRFYARDDELVYSKISGLNEFLTDVFPDKEIDTDNITISWNNSKDQNGNDTVWENLFAEL